MLRYYFGLAVRSLRRNPMLTGLMVAAIGVGISASMTTLTIYRGMAADPIPQKSAELFAPQIDSWGPHPTFTPQTSDHLEDQLTYTDATNLMIRGGARQQAAMYKVALVLTPSNPQIRPFNVPTRATYRAFFSMFDVPFQYGGGWTAANDQNRATVAVISQKLNDKLFDGTDSVGKSIRLNGREYRIVGVLDTWRPIPRFYDLNGNSYGKPEDVFIPFTTSIAERLMTAGNWTCNKKLPSRWNGLLESDCVWIQFWVELPTVSSVRTYRSVLVNYAAQQQRMGRFQWAPRVRLRDVGHWLAYHHLVPDEIRILVSLSFAFLFVCLLNAMALMLARFVSRAGVIGVRRALGASRRAIFVQCIVESGIVGLIGGVLGIGLTILSFAGLRELLSNSARPVLYFDVASAIITILLAVLVTTLIAIYPALRAARLQPTLQLKAL